jgi:hypothetical protein
LGLQQLEQQQESADTNKVATVAAPAANGNSGAIPIPVGVARSGPKVVRPRPNVAAPAVGKAAPVLGDRRPGAGIKPLAPGGASTTAPVPAGDADAPPQPDDDLAFIEEVSGRN